MGFEQPARALQLLVNLGHAPLQFLQVHGRADAGHNVLALRVDQEVAVEGLLASRRVAREANAGAGVLARIAEHHLHHADSSAQQTGDLFHPAIGDRLFRHPRLEHRADGVPKLFLRIFGKIPAGLAAEVLFIFAHQLLPGLRRHLCIVLNLQAFLHGTKFGFELILCQPDDDGRIHLHEATISVIGKAFVPCRSRQAGDRAAIQAQVENRLHHPGHRPSRARAHADQQRIFCVSELFARHSLEALQICGDLPRQFPRMLAIMLEVIVAGYGRDGKPGRDRQADARHLCETGALAPQQVLHFTAALRLSRAKEINVFHGPSSFRTIHRRVG